MQRLVVAVMLLAASGLSRAGALAVEGTGPTSSNGGLMLHEPLDAYWHDRLVGPLVARFTVVDHYRAEPARPGAVVEAVAAERAVGLLRRSSFTASRGPTSPVEALEIGPASCLLLAVRQDAPWRDWGDLVLAREPLSVEAASAGAQDAFAALSAQYPLGAAPKLTLRPLRVAAQVVAREEAHVLAFEAPRRSAAETVSDPVRAVQARGLRLLELPVHLTPRLGARLAGEVVVGEGGWLMGPETAGSFCDPYLLVVPRASADAMIFRLYAGREQTNGTGSLGSRVQAAVQSLRAMVGI